MFKSAGSEQQQQQQRATNAYLSTLIAVDAAASTLAGSMKTRLLQLISLSNFCLRIPSVKGAGRFSFWNFQNVLLEAVFMLIFWRGGVQSFGWSACRPKRSGGRLLHLLWGVTDRARPRFFSALLFLAFLKNLSLLWRSHFSFGRSTDRSTATPVLYLVLEVQTRDGLGRAELFRAGWAGRRWKSVGRGGMGRGRVKKHVNRMIQKFDKSA